MSFRARAGTVLGLAVLAVPGAAVPVGWQETLSPHFQLFHEAAFAPSGLTLTLEKIHNRLRRDLAMFAPWMAKERVRIQLYRTKNSYLYGEHKPPSWSNGVAYYERRLIVSYEQPTPKKLYEVLAHEMAHLLFESYWGEARRQPPSWLNEGLAMLEEADDPERADKAEWFQAMAILGEHNITRVERFVQVAPGKMSGKEAVTVWYVQAYSMVHFLYRRHSRLQFYNFCARMREGKDFPDALWQVYRYTVPRFETAWLAWLRSPEVQGRFQYVTPSARAEPPAPEGKGRLQPVSFRSFEFHGLIPDR